MGGNAVKKNRVPTFCGLCFFPALKKTESTKNWDSFFSQHFPPMSGTQSWNFQTPLSVTSSYMLEPGFRIWLPVIPWHYNLHQTKLFKDFAPKKSNLTYVQKLLQNNLKSTSKLPQLPPKLSQNFWNRFNPSPPTPCIMSKTTPQIP